MKNTSLNVNFGENINEINFEKSFMHISLKRENSRSIENMMKNGVLSGPFSLKREGISLGRDPFPSK